MARDAREVWAKRVERLVDSGLTAKEYAAEIGVNANTLAGWRWRLRSSAVAAQGKDVEPAGAAVDRDTVDGDIALRRDAPAASSTSARKSVTPMKFVELTTAPV